MKTIKEAEVGDLFRYSGTGTIIKVTHFDRTYPVGVIVEARTAGHLPGAKWGKLTVPTYYQFVGSTKKELYEIF